MYRNAFISDLWRKFISDRHKGIARSILFCTSWGPTFLAAVFAKKGHSGGTIYLWSHSHVLENFRMGCTYRFFLCEHCLYQRHGAMLVVSGSALRKSCVIMVMHRYVWGSNASGRTLCDEFHLRLMVAVSVSHLFSTLDATSCKAPLPSGSIVAWSCV